MTRWENATSGLIRWQRQFSAPAGRYGSIGAGAFEFICFVAKQAWACLFGGLLLGSILATRLWYPIGCALPRYDALLIAAIVIQACLLGFRLETMQEAKIILTFHVVGIAMELFKTSVGSWNYPEFSYLKIQHVPLFTGFMYSAVGSYLFRIWRLFDFCFTRHPPLSTLVVLSMVIYANFFSDHWGIDLRFPILLSACWLFRQTNVYFTVWQAPRRMRLLLGFSLVALFIWFGENIGTASGAWLYPNQMHRWVMVSPAKLISWFLLMLISYTMVAVAVARRQGAGGGSVPIE